MNSGLSSEISKWPRSGPDKNLGPENKANSDEENVKICLFLRGFFKWWLGAELNRRHKDFQFFTLQSVTFQTNSILAHKYASLMPIVAV